MSASSSTNGSLWYGRDGFPGFLYKAQMGGTRRSTRMGPGGNFACNVATLNENKYKPGGGGVGASSIATRRAKMRLATVCPAPSDGTAGQCGTFYKYLGVH